MALSDGALAGTPTQTAPVSVPAAAPVGGVKEVKATGIAFLRDTALAGTYKCTASTFLSARDGAGTNHKELARIKHGETVNCSGYFNLVDGARWLYIWFTQNGVSYTAFASASFLKKL